MKKRKLPGVHEFWAVESSVWGLIPYSIREKRFNAWRSVAATEKDWRAFRRQGLYRLIRIRVDVTNITLSKKMEKQIKIADKLYP